MKLSELMIDEAPQFEVFMSRDKMIQRMRAVFSQAGCPPNLISSVGRDDIDIPQYGPALIYPKAIKRNSGNYRMPSLYSYKRADSDPQIVVTGHQTIGDYFKDDEAGYHEAQRCFKKRMAEFQAKLSEELLGEQEELKLEFYMDKAKLDYRLSRLYGDLWGGPGSEDEPSFHEIPDFGPAVIYPKLIDAALVGGHGQVVPMLSLVAIPKSKPDIVVDLNHRAPNKYPNTEEGYERALEFFKSYVPFITGKKVMP